MCERHGFVCLWEIVKMLGGLNVCIYICMPLYTCTHVYMYACMHVCMYVCMHVCMYVCMHVYVYMYVCTYMPWWKYVTDACVLLCNCVYACMYVCTTIYVCLYVCMRICMFVCVCLGDSRSCMHERTCHHSCVSARMIVTLT
jgi:hypothetical protein